MKAQAARVLLVTASQRLDADGTARRYHTLLSIYSNHSNQVKRTGQKEREGK